MHRRTFISTVTGGLLAAPLGAAAQQVGKVPRIGVLSPVAASVASPYIRIIRDGFHDLGYVEGQSIVFELAFAEKDELLPDRVADLVRVKVDVIMTTGTPATLAAKRATGTIPIVMTISNEPVKTGIVASLARPGGNVTGNAILLPELTLKQLELLKELAPHTSRVAVLANPSNSGAILDWMVAQDPARTLGLTLERIDVQDSNDLDGAFTAIIRTRADACLAMADPLIFSNIRRISDFALKHRLPMIMFLCEFVTAGGLVTYGSSVPSLMKRATLIVDKILKGAKPADLPVEQPTTFELVINLKTAKALGLTIPPSLLQRADQVLE
jgi:putative tryptophan/tyrosine transport system substrate-binding protein